MSVRVRSDVAALPPYVPGRAIAEVAAELGIETSEIIKLASNESPEQPFPEVIAAVAESAAGLHRYPDMACRVPAEAVSEALGIDPDNLWFDAGSSALLRTMALAVGGPGTSAVMPWPSFVVYPLGSQLAHTESIRVPLTDHHLDLAAMASAVRSDTTILYVCNPNNPTGTVRGGVDVVAMLDDIPDDVLVVVDEAYGEYVVDPGYRSLVPVALERRNVVVTRTFSKIYGLAALRIGYAVGHPDTLREIRKAQAPFSVSTPAQVAAAAAVRLVDRVRQRVAANRTGVESLEAGFADMALRFIPSQANFVATLPDDPTAVAERLNDAGIITRPLGELLRITVGSPTERERLLQAMAAGLG